MKIGHDNNADGDIDDAGDDIQVSDSFDSGTITLTYDDNGNLTGDGILTYVYDGWNRLVKVNRYADSDTTTIATYAYDGQNRRLSKVVANCGPEADAGDGGNTTVHYYYGDPNRDRQGVAGAGWNILETRNGSNQATRQWVWGTQYVDEILFMDVNGSPDSEDSCDPDTGGIEPETDSRYYYHQDRNWNVVALTEYAAGGDGTDAKVVERYAYTPYGEFIVLTGAPSTGTYERAQVRLTSTVGNPFAHQGLPFDQEKLSYQNRHREYVAAWQRFGQRDPEGYVDGANAYLYTDDAPLRFTDPLGTICTGWGAPGGSAPTVTAATRITGGMNCLWQMCRSCVRTCYLPIIPFCPWTETCAACGTGTWVAYPVNPGGIPLMTLCAGQTPPSNLPPAPSCSAACP